MPDAFTPAEAAILEPYVTNVDRPVFALRNLPEEVVAVLFAYYSRSRDSLRRNLLKLIQDRDLDLAERLVRASRSAEELAAAQRKAREFHEKWVVGYGHASVAEHAVVHLAIEDVSIVASKLIEDARLASFTEKSTRYVVFDRDKFYREPAILASPHAARYAETCGRLLETYTRLTEPVVRAIRAERPRAAGQSERGYEAACLAQACDVLRYLLPAATLTNIGLTANARTLEHLVTKLLSHPLAEAQEVGARIKAEAQAIVPTLIKYAARSPYLADTAPAMQAAAAARLGAAAESHAPGPAVALVRHPDAAEEELVAAILYGYAGRPWAETREAAAKLSAEEREAVVDEYLKRRGPHDQPLRALEHLSYTFEILLDFGAYRDLQRHRMATQTAQEATPAHGYSTPPELGRYGVLEPYRACMREAEAAFHAIAADLPREAQYVLPLAFRKRVLFTWNLREIHHVVQLRSSRQGHAAYRHVAQQIFRELERVHPLLARYIRVDLSEYSLARS
ncbi:MAG: FAD-dependent thymidylate synthase [Candidatus Methylomirabilales bacterium]